MFIWANKGLGTYDRHIKDKKQKTPPASGFAAHRSGWVFRIPPE
jgi:hypothetical protein